MKPNPDEAELCSWGAASSPSPTVPKVTGEHPKLQAPPTPRCFPHLWCPGDIPLVPGGHLPGPCPCPLTFGAGGAPEMGSQERSQVRGGGAPGAFTPSSSPCALGWGGGCCWGCPPPAAAALGNCEETSKMSPIPRSPCPASPCPHPPILGVLSPCDPPTLSFLAGG